MFNARKARKIARKVKEQNYNKKELELILEDIKERANNGYNSIIVTVPSYNRDLYGRELEKLGYIITYYMSFNGDKTDIVVYWG